MGLYKVKIERSLSKDDLADYLREMADSLEGPASIDNELQLACFDKVDLSLKMSGDQAYVRVKMQSHEKGEGDLELATAAKTIQEEGLKPGAMEAGAKPYRPLKKHMKQSFKRMFKAIHEDSFPPADAVESFLRDASEMATYPGKGEGFYSLFAEACDDFAQAFAKKDMPRMRQLIDDLNHMKTECHARYK